MHDYVAWAGWLYLYMKTMQKEAAFWMPGSYSIERSDYMNVLFLYELRTVRLSEFIYFYLLINENGAVRGQ